MKRVIGLVLCLMGVRIAKSQENIAEGKNTFQTSTLDNAVSSNAVDGNISSCSQTKEESFQSWLVELGADYWISEVVLYSSERLQNITVYVLPSNSTFQKDVVCASITTSTLNKEVIQCEGFYGFIVFITRSDGMSLKLCEVEVFQRQNIAEGKNTTQTSTLDNAVSSNAVDGNISSCSQTKEGSFESWYVELGADYWISEVVLYSSERLQNITVSVYPSKPTPELDVVCASITTSTLNKEVIQCEGFYGFIVFITRSDGMSLKLCEVEVFQRPNRDCGVRVIPENVKKIIGGQDANPGSWPWMVHILTNSNDHHCGGSLINDRWILTAAHCFFAYNGSPDVWKIAIGSHNRDQVDEGQMTLDVDFIVLHEDYYPYDNDIALMRLAQPVVFSDTVSAVCLPARSVPAGASCYVTGWGVTQNASYSEVLLQAKVDVLSNAQCNESQYYDGQITENMLCAKHEFGGRDACQGDSGGPLVCQGIDDRWEIQGIVSWGTGCAISNQPGVYTDVTRYTAWITNQLALHP